MSAVRRGALRVEKKIFGMADEEITRNLAEALQQLQSAADKSTAQQVRTKGFELRGRITRERIRRGKYKVTFEAKVDYTRGFLDREQNSTVTKHPFFTWTDFAEDEDKLDAYGPLENGWTLIGAVIVPFSLLSRNPGGEQRAPLDYHDDAVHKMEIAEIGDLFITSDMHEGDIGSLKSDLVPRDIRKKVVDDFLAYVARNAYCGDAIKVH